MTEQDPSQLANELDRQADEMQQRTDELGSNVSEVRQDWERKRTAADVPGAPPPEGDSEAGAEDEPPEQAATGEDS